MTKEKIKYFLRRYDIELQVILLTSFIVTCYSFNTEWFISALIGLVIGCVISKVII